MQWLGFWLYAFDFAAVLNTVTKNFLKYFLSSEIALLFSHVSSQSFLVSIAKFLECPALNIPSLNDLFQCWDSIH